MASQPPYYNPASPYGGQHQYNPPQQPPVQQPYGATPTPPTYGTPSPLPPGPPTQPASSYYPPPPPQSNAQSGHPAHGTYQYPANSQQQLPPANPSYQQYPPPPPGVNQQYPASNIPHQPYPPAQYQSPPSLPTAPARKPVSTTYAQPGYEAAHQAPSLPPRNPSTVTDNRAYTTPSQAVQQSSLFVSTLPRHIPRPFASRSASTYTSGAYSDATPPPVPPRPIGFETSQAPRAPVSHIVQSYPSQSPPRPAIVANPVEQLTSQLGNLNVHTSSQNPVRVPQDEEIEFPRINLAEPRPNGEPNLIQQECPTFRQIDYQMNWYRLPKAPGSLICMNCYHKYIEPTSLRQAFERVGPSTGSCRFNIYRIHFDLWPEAQRTGNMDALVDFMNRRLKIPDCKGATGVRYGEDIKFFSPKTEPPKDSILCEACYEDEVLGSPFADNFMPTKMVLGPKDIWRCAFAGGFVGRALRTYSKQQYGWNQWAQEANKRIYLPLCDGKPCVARSRKWFKIRGGPETFVSCEACFLDKAALTPFANYFEPYTAIIAPGVQFGCDMKLIPVQVAMHMAQSMRDFGIFWRSANAVSTYGACSLQGAKGGSWYHLRGSSADFCLCPICYTGLIEPMKAGNYFEMRTIDKDHAVMCDFTPGAPRVVEYLLQLGQALDTGVWSRFRNYVEKWASVPTCPQDKVSVGVFYGFAEEFPDIAACKNCYEAIIKPSKFDSMIVRREETQFKETKFKGEPLKAMCSFFSPNMRTRWKNACDSGDFAGFMGYAKARVKIWCETVPIWETMLARQKMIQQQAMTAALAGVAYQGMENVVMASSAHRSDHLYGNSSIGWHDTQYGATSAQYNQDMISGFSQAANGNVWMTMAELEKRWKSVM